MIDSLKKKKDNDSLKKKRRTQIQMVLFEGKIGVPQNKKKTTL